MSLKYLMCLVLENKLVWRFKEIKKLIDIKYQKTHLK